MNYLAVLSFFISLNVHAAQSKNNPPVIDAYITVLDEAHLSSVRVNIEKSYDSDGKIDHTEINFGDGFLSAKSDIIHQYAADGVYNISIKAWDNKGALSQYSQSVDVASNLVFSGGVSIYGPKAIVGNTKYLFSGSNSANKKYKLILSKQASGWISGFYRKSLDWYNHHFRASENRNDTFEANVELNDINVFAVNEISKDTVRIEKFVNLKSENQIIFNLKHASRNMYRLEIVEMGYIKDIQPPLISTTIQTDMITKDNQLPVTISDTSGRVTTSVWKVMLQAQNGPPASAGTVNQLILTTDATSFNIPLTEGSNSFILRSQDIFGNVSNYYYINNIIFDGTAPEILSLTPQLAGTFYFYNIPPVQVTLPLTKYFDIVASERIASLELISGASNLNLVFTDVPRTKVSGRFTINHDGVSVVQFKIKDYVGNERVYSYSINNIIVTDAIQFTANPAQNQTYYTNQNFFNISFNAQSSYPIYNKIFVNNVLNSTSNVTSGSASVPLTREGTNTIDLQFFYSFESLYSAGYVGWTIIKDSIEPTISSSSPENNSTIYTNHLPLTIPVNIVFSEFLSNISVNNISQPTFSNTYATNYFASTAGIQQLQIVATDRAGNIGNLTHTVNVDFSDTLPVLNFDAAIKELLTNKISVPISGTSDKILTSARLNGQPISVGADGKTFFGVFDAPANGRYNLIVTGTDRYGNVGTTSTFIRVLQGLPDSLLPPRPPSLVYVDETKSYIPDFGPQFQQPQSDDICAALDNVFEQDLEFKDNLNNLEANLQAAASEGITLQIPRQQDLEDFMGNIEEGLNYIKGPYLMMCKGINIIPDSDCPTNRKLFKLVMGSYPEPLIIKAIPGLAPSVQNFLIPRLNICTGFDDSGLSCNDMVQFLPLIADFVFPGVGQIMSSAAGQAITKALMCDELCNTPLAKTTLVCTQLDLPEVPNVPFPTPISLPPRLGDGPGDDFGGGGGGGGGGGCSWFDPCDDDGGGGSGGSGDDGIFLCATYPMLAFCGSNGSYTRDRIVIDAGIDCDILNNSKFSDIYNIALSRSVTVTELYSSYLAKCFKSPLPGFPKITKPVLTVTAPVQNQLVTDTVRVTGYVDDVYAQVKVNGQLVPTIITVLGGAFDVTIATPVDRVVRVEAADLFMNRALPIEVPINSPDILARVFNNNLFSLPYLIIDEALYVMSSDSKLLPVLGMQAGVSAVSAGSGFVCVLVSLRVKCWGENGVGQIGLPRSGNVNIPHELDLGGDVKQISSAPNHACALLMNGSVKCWGYNAYGALGNGTTYDSDGPGNVIGLQSDVESIVTAQYHNCAALSSGLIKCWGVNSVGQLGDGTTLRALVPVTVLGYNMAGPITLSGTVASTCALTKNSIKCWGFNGLGWLGDGTGVSSYAPVNVINFSNSIVEGSLTSANQHICAMDDSNMKCWGNNSSGQLGNLGSGSINAGNYSLYPLVVDVVDASHATSIWAGDEITCVVVNNEVYCWGQGYGRQPVKYSR